jgi:hypothetical protein
MFFEELGEGFTIITSYFKCPPCEYWLRKRITRPSTMALDAHCNARTRKRSTRRAEKVKIDSSRPAMMGMESRIARELNHKTKLRL